MRMINNIVDITENEIASIVVGKSFTIHKKFGQGLIERIYEGVLIYDLACREIFPQRQKTIEGVNDVVIIDKDFNAEIIVENKVIIALKTVESILPVYQKQLLTYLKLTEMKLGLLVNFDVDLIKNGIQRIVNNLLAIISLCVLNTRRLCVKI